MFLKICRGKKLIFTDVKNSTTLLDVKQIVQGLLKVAPGHQRLYWSTQVGALSGACQCVCGWV